MTSEISIRIHRISASRKTFDKSDIVKNASEIKVTDILLEVFKNPLNKIHDIHLLSAIKSLNRPLK